MFALRRACVRCTNITALPRPTYARFPRAMSTGGPEDPLKFPAAITVSKPEVPKEVESPAAVVKEETASVSAPDVSAASEKVQEPKRIESSTAVPKSASVVSDFNDSATPEKVEQPKLSESPTLESPSLVATLKDLVPREKIEAPEVSKSSTPESTSFVSALKDLVTPEKVEEPKGKESLTPVTESASFVSTLKDLVTPEKVEEPKVNQASTQVQETPSLVSALKDLVTPEKVEQPKANGTAAQVPENSSTVPALKNLGTPEKAEEPKVIESATTHFPQSASFASALKSAITASKPGEQPKETQPAKAQPAPLTKSPGAEFVEEFGVDLSKGHAARIAKILRNDTPLSLSPRGTPAPAEPSVYEEYKAALSSKPATTTPATPTATTASQKPIEKHAHRPKTELTLTEAFVNNIMKDGKKARARRIIRDALAYIQREAPAGSDPHVVLESAVNKVAPLVKLVTQKRGSKGLQTPTPLAERQRRRFGILWIVDAASGGKSTMGLGEKIGKEVLAVVEGTSSALQKRMNIHKQALMNRSNVLMVDRKVRKM
ncbi:uncharacterized protein EV422DRAFT_516268 [Fimicolochytrium jonesii]|uniref:uncharacterized protein n=1 Tax=Fimicolochytrium jonesii TaxID=1396493 RepID=UPI0022FF0479|nr:uncharacterized protein EV422DRAFT_516268 [Fimicolochytrium jonesii]KAI8824812.1 hypothetical protein EV422DRAFT_516268 [Fimicolochytrium jonesii]